MTEQEYKATFSRYLAETEQRLVTLCDAYLPAGRAICDAARYSLLGGGKRIRAVLTLAACELCTGAGLCLCAGNAALLLADTR